MSARLSMTASYLTEIWDRCDKTIATAKEKLEPVLFDTIIGTGVSGAIIVPLLARELGCFWAIARKPRDGSHSYNEVEGDIGERWVFVDDLVDSGATVERTRRLVTAWTGRWGWDTEYAGTYLYYSKRYYPEDHDFQSRWSCDCAWCEENPF